MKMFEKKCKRCNKKLGKDFSFCPYCGFENKSFFDEEKGMLDNDLSMPSFGLFGSGFGGMFDSLAKNLFREMEKQFREVDRTIGEEKRMKKVEKTNRIPISSSGISISIAMNGDNTPVIKVRNVGGDNRDNKPEPTRAKNPQISEDEARKFSQLPKKEADTRVRRMSDKIIYEIDVPGVDDTKKVFITKLENSIEIKAFSKDKAYFKLIPISLPLEKYSLKDGKLVLELGMR